MRLDDTQLDKAGHIVVVGARGRRKRRSRVGDDLAGDRTQTVLAPPGGPFAWDTDVVGEGGLEGVAVSEEGSVLVELAEAADVEERDEEEGRGVA